MHATPHVVDGDTIPPQAIDIDALGSTLRIGMNNLLPVERAATIEAWSGAVSLTAAGAGASTTWGRAPWTTVDAQRWPQFADGLASLTTRMTLAAMEARRGHLWMVHAGAIADSRGRVVMFAGPSGMGKTTLISRAARNYSYVSDETTGVATDGHVYPYRKPLSVIREPGRAKQQVSPRALGLKELPDTPLKLHAVVLLDRDEKHLTAHLEPIDSVDAIRELNPQCSYLAELDAPLDVLVGHLEAVGGAQRLSYRETEDVLPLLPGIFTARPYSWRKGWGMPVHLGTEPSMAVPAEESLFVQTPVIDAVPLPGEQVAVMNSDETGQARVYVIDGIAPTLWRAARGQTFDHLVDIVVSSFGTPRQGDARINVRHALDALISMKLIDEVHP